MGVRTPPPKVGIFKQGARRPRARDKQIGSGYDTRTSVSQRVSFDTQITPLEIELLGQRLNSGDNSRLLRVRFGLFRVSRTTT
jgi:hypothetical protein